MGSCNNWYIGVAFCVTPTQTHPRIRQKDKRPLFPSQWPPRLEGSTAPLGATKSTCNGHYFPA